MAKQPAFSADDLLPMKDRKPSAITADDLIPSKERKTTAMRQRGVVPSAELVPLQFKMPPDFVRAFKQEALNRGEKLNEFQNSIFQHFMKTGKNL
jgi:hypothetical protein